jgi:hypothetical protein
MTYYPGRGSVQGMEPKRDPAYRDRKRYRNGTGIGKVKKGMGVDS